MWWGELESWKRWGRKPCQYALSSVTITGIVHLFQRAGRREQGESGEEFSLVCGPCSSQMLVKGGCGVGIINKCSHARNGS